MLATLLKALLRLWHLCTWRGDNWLGGFVKACNAFWQQLLFWGALFFYYHPPHLLPQPITIHQSYKDMACWQIKRAPPLHFDSICTGSFLEIILVRNIISKYGVLHNARCNEYHILPPQTSDLIILFGFTQQNSIQMHWDQFYMLTNTLHTPLYIYIKSSYSLLAPFWSQIHKHTKL